MLMKRLTKMSNFMRIESKRDRLQLAAFMTIYSFTCITSYGFWLQTAYLVNNLILLAISVVPIFLTDSHKVFYMFGYACAYSLWIDLFTIPCNLFFGNVVLENTFQRITYIVTVVSAVGFVLVKFIMCISEIQIARYLNNQPELRFRFNIDLFNHTRGLKTTSSRKPSQHQSGEAGCKRDDVTVNLSQISPNTTEVNQTTEIGQTINSELKFEKSLDMDKHLVPH